MADSFSGSTVGWLMGPTARGQVADVACSHYAYGELSLCVWRRLIPFMSRDCEARHVPLPILIGGRQLAGVCSFISMMRIKSENYSADQIF
jgi:hypothetical protein